MSFASNSKNDKLYQTNERYEHLTDTSNFWVSNQALINQYKPVNLGIGFPDYNGYKNLKNIATEVINDSDHKIHQYTRVEGHLPLCNAVAKYYFKKHGLFVNPLNEILITPGGDGALHYISLAFLNKGDEIILFEPFFLNYQFTFEPSGATLVYVSLKYNKILDENGYYQSSDWTWDEKELEAAFSSKTKIVLINSPNNPLGKVFNDNELKKIVQLCIKYNAILLSDEVYENYIFNESCAHLKIIEKFPEIRDRTLTIGSAGKTFGITGAKTGWIIGCEQLVKKCTIAHTNSLYVLSTLIQEILARCFETELAKIDSPDCHFNQISADIKPKRDRLARLLRDAGFIPIIPDGGIFILADFSKIAQILKNDSDDQMDIYFNKYLIKKGLASFPASKFFSSSNSTGENLIRFCFFKTDATLDLAAKVLLSIIDTK